MKYLAAGLGVLVVAGLNLVFLTTFPNAPVMPQTVALANILLVMVGLLVLFSGGGEVRRQAQGMRDDDAAKAKIAELEPRLASFEQAHQALEVELEKTRASANEAANEAKIKIAGLEESLRTLRAKSAERPEAVDAELVELLSLLQRRGRFVDFLMDDIARYDDAQVGAAARVVHRGCAEVVREFFDIEPIRTDAEGGLVTLASDYEPERYQLVGKVAGTPPFRGTLLHRGWRTTRVSLPKIAAAGKHDVIAPAEVELN